jgi:hypothetical protein
LINKRKRKEEEGNQPVYIRNGACKLWSYFPIFYESFPYPDLLRPSSKEEMGGSLFAPSSRRPDFAVQGKSRAVGKCFQRGFLCSKDQQITGWPKLGPIGRRSIQQRNQPIQIFLLFRRIYSYPKEDPHGLRFHSFLLK